MKSKKSIEKRIKRELKNKIIWKEKGYDVSYFVSVGILDALKWVLEVKQK